MSNISAMIQMSIHDSASIKEKGVSCTGWRLW